jgi:aminoglycoside phosphotransferase (APT) family kinase protein
MPNNKNLHIDISLAQKLVRSQFVQWKDLKIKQVKAGGNDNRSFRLGDDLLIRLPSAEGYVAQVIKEQKWLPILAANLSMQIPEPVAMGQPCKDYPWNWSIYKWIVGISANQLKFTNSELEILAEDLAKFLNELHLVSIENAPMGGLHNYYRGCHLSVYDNDARSDIMKLSSIIDAAKALDVWEKAISLKWHKDPVWIHGDLASGNFLVEESKLSAVIDFGCMGIGDPACDLVIAWTFLRNKSREIFKKYLNIDSDSWARARGWALWKANFEIVALKDKKSAKAIELLQIVADILHEHEQEY